MLELLSSGLDVDNIIDYSILLKVGVREVRGC